jgi:hypothetical protein
VSRTHCSLIAIRNYCSADARTDKKGPRRLPAGRPFRRTPPHALRPGTPGAGAVRRRLLAYDASRWLFAGRLGAAREHAHWVIELERSLHVAVEGSVQHALD